MHLYNLDLRLASIQSFLNRVALSVDEEYSAIIRQIEAGYFNTYDDEINACYNDDEENAFYDAWQCEDIAIRATFAELNVFIESTFQSLAVIPFANFQRQRGDESLKNVTRLNFQTLRDLIENHYQIDMEGLPHFQDIQDIRETVNAYKHRNGYPDPFKDPNNIRFGERIRLDRKAAFEKIEAVRKFLQALFAVAEPD